MKVGERKDNGQCCNRARHAAIGIQSDETVAARIGRLHIGNDEHGAPRPGQIGAVKKPLISQRRRAGCVGHQCFVAACHDSLVCRSAENDRRRRRDRRPGTNCQPENAAKPGGTATSRCCAIETAVTALAETSSRAGRVNPAKGEFRLEHTAGAYLKSCAIPDIAIGVHVIGAVSTVFRRAVKIPIRSLDQPGVGVASVSEACEGVKAVECAIGYLKDAAVAVCAPGVCCTIQIAVHTQNQPAVRIGPVVAAREAVQGGKRTICRCLEHCAETNFP